MCKPNESVVLAVGGFPPPVTGAAKNLSLICSEIERQSVRLVRANIARGSVAGRWRFLLRRLWRYATAWAALVRHRGPRKNRTLYLVPDGGPGLVLTLITAILARQLSYRIILQHRTFHYVRERKHAMASINRVIGPTGLHVFLSQGMADSFSAKYSPNRPYLVNHNLAQTQGFFDAARRIPRDRHPGLFTVGYLSNLIPAKGFETFLDIARAAERADLPCRFVLAGAAPSPIEEEKVNAALTELGDRLEWRGPLFGAEKLRFYRDLDIFVFPTRYPYEAQPNVVLEAICAGAYVIASDRGCIAEDLGDLGGTCIPVAIERDVAAWTEALVDAISNPDRLIRKRAESTREVNLRIDRARASFQRLLTEMTSPAAQTSGTGR